MRRDLQGSTSGLIINYQHIYIYRLPWSNFSSLPGPLDFVVCAIIPILVSHYLVDHFIITLTRPRLMFVISSWILLFYSHYIVNLF